MQANRQKREKERDGKTGRKLDRAKRQLYGCRHGQTETKWKCTQTEN